MPPIERAPWIDGSLYPDTEVPIRVETLAERVDFLVRLCGAWDFGILPEQPTIDRITRADWAPAVDACRLLTSPSYHLLREWHGLEGLEYLGRRLPEIADDPSLAFV